jgi:histidine triad (HIT) family protein
VLIREYTANCKRTCKTAVRKRYEGLMNDCIFCKIAHHQVPAWMVHETDRSFAFLDIHPMNPYHTLIIPKAHFNNIFDVPTEVLQEMMGTLKHVVDLYRDKLGMTDMQIINSNGKAGQQDVFHIHFHIAPRHSGDGQDIQWRTSPEMRSEYDNMLKKLGIGRLGGMAS